MIIDLIFIVLLVIAIIKGYQRGLIVAVFSFVAIFIGLAAALKLSAVVAANIGRSVKGWNQWLPLIAFAVVFIIVVLLVRLAAAFIERTVQFAMLGWVNRLGGMVFYIALYTIILSVLIFYAEQVKFISPAITQKSFTYSYVQPWGPKAINAFGSILPVFKNIFTQLQDFFGNLSHKLQ